MLEVVLDPGLELEPEDPELEPEPEPEDPEEPEEPEEPDPDDEDPIAEGEDEYEPEATIVVVGPEPAADVV